MPADQEVLDIKKYPNRRFYDATRKRHVTMADLYGVVRSGRHIHVTDSKTGDDITNVVLTQIILEHDPPKLDLFPAALLHQTIQANQQVVRNFIDEYFARAMDAFMGSRQRFDEFMHQAGRALISPTAPMDWARAMFGAAAPRPAAPSAPGAGATKRTEAVPSSDDARHSANADAATQPQDDNLRSLRERLDALTAELAELRREPQPRPRRSGRRKPR